MLSLVRMVAFAATLTFLAGATPPYVTVHHPVSTQNELAQRYFDEALTLCYAYNGSEALPLFERAISLDPHLAIAYYGIALAAGPDLNSPLTPEGFKRAAAALAQARSFKSYANPSEREYIGVLSQRYAHQFKDREADDARYRSSMADLVAHYPNDDDALTLYTEAMLERSGRGDLWKSDGAPRSADVTTMLGNLSTVLQRTPAHIGANHLFIHLFDSAPSADPALPSAHRLTQMNFAPAAEHLAHMPAHTFIETGNYAAAASASRETLQLFDAYLASDHNPAHDNYWSHDAGVGVTALRMLGNYGNALQLSRRLDEHFHSSDSSALTMLRFYRWNEVLQLHPTEVSDVVRFARGISFAATGNVGEAEKALEALIKAQSDPLSRDLLGAKIALARQDVPRAETLLLRGQAGDQPMNSGEDPYFYPSDEALGALYFRIHQLPKAEAAFRRALRTHPHGGRALFGLWKTLDAENKGKADTVKRQFEDAWQSSDTTLDMGRL